MLGLAGGDLDLGRREIEVGLVERGVASHRRIGDREAGRLRHQVDQASLASASRPWRACIRTGSDSQSGVSDSLAMRALSAVHSGIAARSMPRASSADTR